MNFAMNRPDRRPVFSPTYYSIANYSTETKKEMGTTFADDLFLNNLHLIPDPLMKNLADTIITEEKMAPKSKLNNNIDLKTNEDMHIGPDYSPLSGITSFFSGVMNVITSAMFSKRKQSEFVAEPSSQMAVESMWHGAKTLDENKILQDENRSNEKSSELLASEMTDCKKAAAHCQNKIEQVRLLLTGSKPVPCNFRARRRPKRVFVEASSVEDSFEDAFSPEDFETIANESFTEFSSPVCYHDHVFHEIDGPKVKTETAKIPQNIPELLEVCEKTEIVKNVPEIVTANENKLECDTKPEVVSTCEDKLNKLKELLQDRKKKSKPIVEPEPVFVPELPKPKTKVKDKKFKNPNRTCGKRMKSKMKKSIQDDLQFANEIIIEDASSVENSPSLSCLEKIITAMKPEKEYFDEVSGCFLPGSVTESEDSFQIVFNDCPKLRKTSDCESEDSFIIFEDSPDSCYTSNDVFGETSDSEDYDSDSDMSDSGCGNFSFNLAASLSKSVCNLADDSLYAEHSEDEVDCANVRDVTMCESMDLGCAEPDGVKTGLLIDDRKKQQRKNLPAKRLSSESVLCTECMVILQDRASTLIDGNAIPLPAFGHRSLCFSCGKSILHTTRTHAVKSVRQEWNIILRKVPLHLVQFSDEPPKVHVMRVWSFAARQARAGHWERYALDRERFKRRIADVEVAISWVLKPQHRSRVMFQQIMPYRNAQKRKELAEKKEREAQEKLRREEEALRAAQVENQKTITEECENSKPSGDNETNKVLLNGEVFMNDVKELTKATDLMESNPSNVTENVEVAKKNIESETVLVNGVFKNVKDNLKELSKAADVTDTKESKKISSQVDVTKTEIIPFNDKFFDLKPDFVKQAILDT